MDIRKKTFLAITIEFAVIALIMFLSAGTIAWPAGWAFLVLLYGYSIPIVLWLLKRCPGVIEERMAVFKPNQKAWDKVFIVALLSLFIIWLVVIPLDAVRFRWSHIPLWLQGVGVILLLISFYIFYITFRVNPFLSATVRIQEERGQTVITTGPYRYVRHPLYSGGILFFFGTAFMLGSWYGVLLSLVFTIMVAVRAVFEERLLAEELEGYDAYMARVKYRLVPHIW